MIVYSQQVYCRGQSNVSLGTLKFHFTTPYGTVQTAKMVDIIDRAFSKAFETYSDLMGECEAVRVEAWKDHKHGIFYEICVQIQRQKLRPKQANAVWAIAEDEAKQFELIEFGREIALSDDEDDDESRDHATSDDSSA